VYQVSCSSIAIEITPSSSRPNKRIVACPSGNGGELSVAFAFAPGVRPTRHGKQHIVDLELGCLESDATYAKAILSGPWLMVMETNAICFQNQRRSTAGTDLNL
jgi:hypothetical protein